LNYRKQFFTYLAVVTFLLIAAYFGCNQFANLNIPNVVLWLIPAFAVLTGLLFIYIANTTDKSPSRFVTAALGSVTSKLLLSAMFFGAYVYFNQEGRVHVGLSLFVVYMSFTTLMTTMVGKYVRGIQDRLRRNSNESK